MNSRRIKNFINWLDGSTFNKILLWLVLSLTLSVTFLRDFWANLPSMLSPDWILGQHHASPWAVLVLCLIFLWLKRKEVWQRMNENKAFQSLRAAPAYYLLNFELPLGIAMVVVAIIMPSSRDFLVFQVLLASLGIFTIIFRKAAIIPTILLAVYCFAISFPLLIERFAEHAYSKVALVPTMGSMTLLGYPLQNQGQWVHFTSATSEPIRVAITAGCAGPATMGVFIALFALMMLDMPLGPKKAAGLFLFGVAGTWVQSFIRLIVLLLIGYHLGEDALWTAHFWVTIQAQSSKGTKAQSRFAY